MPSFMIVWVCDPKSGILIFFIDFVDHLNYYGEYNVWRYNRERYNLWKYNLWSCLIVLNFFLWGYDFEDIILEYNPRFFFRERYDFEDTILIYNPMIGYDIVWKLSMMIFHVVVYWKWFIISSENRAVIQFIQWLIVSNSKLQKKIW